MSVLRKKTSSVYNVQCWFTSTPSCNCIIHQSNKHFHTLHFIRMVNDVPNASNVKSIFWKNISSEEKKSDTLSQTIMSWIIIKTNFHNLSERITSSSTLNLKETPEAYVTHYTSPSDSQDHHTWKQGEHTALLFFYFFFFYILCRTFTLSKHFCCVIITRILF